MEIGMKTNEEKSYIPKPLIITNEAPYWFCRDNLKQEMKMIKRAASGQQTAVNVLREIYPETIHFCALTDPPVEDNMFDECAKRIRDIDDKVQPVRIPIEIGLLSNMLNIAKLYPICLQMDESIVHLANEDEAWKAVLKVVEEEYQSSVRTTLPIMWIHNFRFWLTPKLVRQECHKDIADLYRDNNNNTFDHKIIIGIDRLDYCKGLEMKVKVFQRLLEKYPEHNGKIQYLQVAVPVWPDQPGFKHLPQQYKTLVAQTNDSLEENGFSSRIHAVLEEVPHHHLPALYKNARIGFVTPYRDGLNLVALEYVASQTSDPGVLVLSNCAGASEFMHEALKVDPKDIENVVDTMHRALTMPREERHKRVTKLKQRVKQELDIYQWAEKSLKVIMAKNPVL